MNQYDRDNLEKWTKEIYKNVQLYPSERVVALLSRNCANKDNNLGKKALDIGFGSGKHLKLLLDFGFNVYGVDYSEECLKVATKLLGNHPNLKELITKDFIEYKDRKEKFDLLLLWGVIFLRKKVEIKRDLKILNELLVDTGKLL